MNYKILVFTSILLLGCKDQKKESSNLLDFVPQNTIASIQINDRNMLENTLDNLPFLREILKLKSNLYKKISAVIPKEFTPNSILSITPEGKENFAVSFLYKIDSMDSIQRNNSKTFTYNSVSISLDTIESQTIYSSTMKDIRFISSSQLVLENSIRNIQNQKKGIQNDQFYKLATVINSNAPMTIYLHKDINILMNDLFPKTDFFPFLGGNWFSFDFNTKKDPFTLDGVSFINDSIPNKLSLLKGLQAQTLTSPKFIPQNFDNYIALAVSDYKSLEDNFKKFSRYKNIPLSEINFNGLSSVDEIALLKNKSNEALYLHLNNSEILPSELFSDIEIKDYYRGVNIKSQTLPDDFIVFLKAFGMSFVPKYVAKIKDFLIYTSNKSFIKQLIANHLDGNTLNKDLNFISLQEDLADNSTFLWVGNTSNLKDQWGKVNGNKKNIWDKIKIESYPLLVIQGISEDRYVQSRFTIQRNNPKQEKNSVINQFSFNLDAPLATNPQWIQNHRNKTMDIVVQDQNNVLYLFSNTGTLFWKKQLSGPIVGKIEQVDLYKNKRLQMAFRTPNRFLILDRNGKVVEPFDKKIFSEAPHHLSVFDYDLNRNYRFLLSHGKKIEMFDNKGLKVKGFKLKVLKQPLRNPAKHIRFGTKDYIVLQDIKGQVKIINRQGNDRIRLKSNTNTSSNPVFAYRNTFASTTKDGAFLQIDTKGNLTKNLLGLRPGHLINMTSKSLVTLSENKLVIKGIPVMLPFGNYTAPKIHYLNNTIFVTLTDLDSQKVYAFYSNGSLVGGFPVYGSSVADLSNADNDNAIEMVVQSEEEGMLIYQIN